MWVREVWTEKAQITYPYRKKSKYRFCLIYCPFISKKVSKSHSSQKRRKLTPFFRRKTVVF
jgi:hypothetical protein